MPLRVEDEIAYEVSLSLMDNVVRSAIARLSRARLSILRRLSRAIELNHTEAEETLRRHLDAIDARTEVLSKYVRLTV